MGYEKWLIAAASGAGFLIIFPVFWCGIVILISRMTGWARLAEFYGTDRPAAGPTWRFQSVYMRWGSHYGNVVTMSAEFDGLRIALFPLFRPGHPPLLVPWNEIAAKSAAHRVLFQPMTELRFARAPEIAFHISETAFQRIAAASSGQLKSTTPKT